MEAARAADAIAVAVTTGPHDDRELRAAGAHVVFRSLEEFPAWWASRSSRSDRPRLDGGG
jgi:phosphoglycolate phosphatase